MKLGLTAFGGPAAHIALMEREFVARRRWLTHQQFLDMIAAANLIPGPNSTEVAIHIGRLRAGWRGLVVAGTAFILPAALIVGGLAWTYARYGALPELQGILYGVKPVIIAVVLQAVWALGKSALKSKVLIAVGLVALACSAAGVNELLVLAVSGLFMAAAQGWPRRLTPGMVASLAPFGLLPVATLAGSTSTVAVTAPTVAAIFWCFARIGSVLFGSGYVLLAFLRADLVEHWHWLTEAQLLDATAVGQFTPGPVFTTATFIGFLLSGWRGAVAATFGIFLPAFFFVALSAPFLPKLRASPRLSALLDGLNVASLALMAVVGVALGRSALVDPFTTLLAGLSWAVLWRYKTHSGWLVLAGGLLGVGARYFQGVS